VTASEKNPRRFSPEELNRLFEIGREAERDAGVPQRERRYSMGAVARFVRVDVATLRNWMYGETQPNTDQFLALCHYFGVPPEELSEPVD